MPYLLFYLLNPLFSIAIAPFTTMLDINDDFDVSQFLILDSESDTNDTISLNNNNDIIDDQLLNEIDNLFNPTVKKQNHPVKPNTPTNTNSTMRKKHRSSTITIPPTQPNKSMAQRAAAVASANSLNKPFPKKHYENARAAAKAVSRNSPISSTTPSLKSSSSFSHHHTSPHAIISSPITPTTNRKKIEKRQSVPNISSSNTSIYSKTSKNSKSSKSSKNSKNSKNSTFSYYHASNSISSFSSSETLESIITNFQSNDTIKIVPFTYPTDTPNKKNSKENKVESPTTPVTATTHRFGMLSTNSPSTNNTPRSYSIDTHYQRNSIQAVPQISVWKIPPSSPNNNNINNTNTNTNINNEITHIRQSSIDYSPRTSRTSTISNHSISSNSNTNTNSNDATAQPTYIPTTPTTPTNNNTSHTITTNTNNTVSFKNLITTFNKKERSPKPARAKVYNNMVQGLVEFQVKVKTKR